jgi:hypothetical protein
MYHLRGFLIWLMYFFYLNIELTEGSGSDFGFDSFNEGCIVAVNVITTGPKNERAIGM